MKYKVSGFTISNSGRNLCQTGWFFPNRAARGRPKKLEEPELDLVQLLIKQRPSITYKEKKENLDEHSNARASISAIGRARYWHLRSNMM